MNEFLIKTKKHIKKILVSYRLLPQRKQYLEFLTALLSIPVLLTVMILNINSLHSLSGNNNAKISNTPTVNQREKVIVVTGTTQNPTGVSMTPVPCDQKFAQITISYPQEGVTISDNPLPIDISAPQSDQCGVTWSYKVNGGNWSMYDTHSISLYNLSSGNIEIDIRVKNTQGLQKVLIRHFIYQGGITIPTPTLTATPTPPLSPSNQSSQSAH